MTDIVLSELQQQVLFYHGRKFDFRVDQLRLPHGAVGEYAYIRHPGAAIAVPVTAAGEFVLVRQYRFPLQRYVLEFPAGTLEKDEAPAQTMARELEEETGYHAHRWAALGSFYICPGYSDEVIHAYLAEDLELLAQPPAQDADEEIEVVLLDRQALQQMIVSQSASQNLDAKSITAFYLAVSRLA
mgnify:CR=1 FL=1